MGIFLLITTILVIIALAFILPPIWGRGQKIACDRKQFNAAIYRERFSELEEQYRNELIDHEEFEIGRAEIQRAALSDLSPVDSTGSKVSGDLASHGGPTGDDAPQGSPRPNPPVPGGFSARGVTAVLIALAVPAASFGLYFHWGSPVFLTGEGKHAPSAPHAARSPDSSSTPPPLEDMVDRLATRLRHEPDNPEGWLMLGRSYAVMGRREEANKAFAEAWQRQPENPEILVSYAESLAGGNDGDMAGRPTELIRAALDIEPDFPAALWLAGVGAYQQGRYHEAVGHWEKLQKGGQISEEEQKMLTEILLEARKAMEN